MEVTATWKGDVVVVELVERHHAVFQPGPALDIKALVDKLAHELAYSLGNYDAADDIKKALLAL